MRIGQALRSARPVRARRLLVAVVGLAMLAASGCGGDDSEVAKDDGKPLRLWVRAGEESVKDYKALAAEFTKQTGTKVDVFGTVTDFDQRLNAAASAKDLPDLITAESSTVNSLVQRKLVTEVDRTSIKGGDQLPGGGSGSPGQADFLLLNGLPTAELTALAYRGIGVTAYSSAVFCFAPEIALGFNRALRAGDVATLARYLDGFYRPLAELRDLGAGYAVSLIKAAVRLRGLDAGSVRPPLTDPPPEHLDRLAAIIDRGLALTREAG
jgi:hypothetical protein